MKENMHLSTLCLSVFFPRASVARKPLGFYTPNFCPRLWEEGHIPPRWGSALGSRQSHTCVCRMSPNLTGSALLWFLLKKENFLFLISRYNMSGQVLSQVKMLSVLHSRGSNYVYEYQTNKCSQIYYCVLHVTWKIFVLIRVYLTAFVAKLVTSKDPWTRVESNITEI